MVMRKAPFWHCGPAKERNTGLRNTAAAQLGNAIPERDALGGWRRARLSVKVALIMSSALYASSFSPALASTAGMRALVAERARIQRLLDFTVALARAEAAVGVVPALATDKIAEAAQAERYEAALLASDGSSAAALFSALTAEVARSDAEAARVVGFGASEQDA